MAHIEQNGEQSDPLGKGEQPGCRGAHRNERSPLDLILVVFADDISGWIIDGGKWLFENLNSL
ncbi:hypothetical protein [Streptomyces sp. NPDC023588]|uniref:hypothetical protein n=1 Tax=Streptomyces sp. NPDC023588 TaxID=3154907 RepID=UPI0033E90919